MKTRTTDQASAMRQGTGAESAAGQAFPWLLRQKITVPERMAGYVHRAELVSRAMPTCRRLTVLKASAGFGKTTLLAECCRRLRQDDVPTAWVSLDAQDEPAVLDIYIAFACHKAGLDLFNVSDPEVTDLGPRSRVGLVVREIQKLGRPFVIAFDELEQLGDPVSVSLLEFLLQRGPSNLHLAFAGRQIPDGLNVAGAVLEGRAEVLTTEELRFSKPEVARFFDLSLSRTELTVEMDRSAGWPLALQVSRNWMERGAEGLTGTAEDLVENWIESRLFARLAREDRELLLDIGLFGWLEAPLLDEVLQCNDSMHRLASMRVLGGLLEPVSDGAAESWRLHPLVRAHCAERRFRENPQRFRAIHGRIAEALMRRGDAVAAVRHALEGGDSVLAADILERGGGVRLWVRQGYVPLQAVDWYLSDDVVSRRPRLALVRCMALFKAGRFEEALRRFRTVVAPRPPDDEDERGTDFEYLVDQCLVRSAFAMSGLETFDSEWTRTLTGDYVRLMEMESPCLEPATLALMEYGLSILYQMKAEFDAAQNRLAGAPPFLAQSPGFAIFSRILGGQIAMAQGHVQDAESHYRSARRMARKGYLLDPLPASGADVLLQELALECAWVRSAADLRSVPKAFMTDGVPFAALAAAIGVVVELKLRDGDPGKALATAEELLARVRDSGLLAATRYAAALRISVLVAAGRIRDAERAWRRENLPEDPDGCVDLAGQSWREMEAVACARLRYLTASERFDEGRSLARALVSVAGERRLRRTQMRTLALSMVLEQRAGEPESATGHLETFLSLYDETPYTWPAVLEGETCVAVVTMFLERNPDSPYQESAQSLLAAIRREDDVRELALSERERTVLLRLASHRDKQIAAVLGLTVHGARYHMRSLFAKLGVGTRAGAVRRARELGLIPDDS